MIDDPEKAVTGFLSQVGPAVAAMLGDRGIPEGYEVSKIRMQDGTTYHRRADLDDPTRAR
jgi:hypothetical protein